jgi:hypothetical protein
VIGADRKMQGITGAHAQGIAIYPDKASITIVIAHPANEIAGRLGFTNRSDEVIDMEKLDDELSIFVFDGPFVIEYRHGNPSRIRSSRRRLTMPGPSGHHVVRQGRPLIGRHPRGGSRCVNLRYCMQFRRTGRARADIPEALRILDRAGIGQPPIKGDELPDAAPKRSPARQSRNVS